MIRSIFSFVFLGIFIIACGNDEAKFPKQRMYPYVNFPVKKDTLFVNNDCDFTFPHPTYLSYKKDSFYFGEKAMNDCWFDLNSKALNTTIYCSYYPINKITNLDSLIKDAFELTNKHNVKANARRESVISNGKGLGGLLFEVDGPVATPIQFFITDSTKHFFRGAVYFNARVNTDSTAPILKYIKTDVEQIINGFKWNKNGK
jgi:gliding motility-associated lipoprotein GldD